MINGFDNEEIWNPNKHFGVGPIEKDVSFGEVWKATYQRVTSPIITHIQNAKAFKGYDGVDDPEFNLKMEMFKPKHYPYINTFGDVTSQPELTARLKDLDERIEVRETLASAPYKYLIPAELLNPINLLALPFGVGEARFLASIAKVGLSNAIIEGGFEAARAPFDPTSIPYETPINMGAAFVFGGFLQGLIRAPSAIKARNLNKLMDDYNALTTGLDDLTPDAINDMPSVKDRAYGKYTNDQLKKLIKNTKNTQEIYNLNRELSVRTIEYWKTKDPNDIYKKDNFFLRFVPTPFKSFLNSNLTKTKAYMHQLGGDHALMTVGNLMGLTQGPSIYTLAKLHTSKVIVLRAQLQKLWGEEIGGVTEGAGMNLTNYGNKLANLNPLQKNKMTMEDWMIEVNKARIADDPSYRMSVKQKEAAELITKFFKNEEVELRKLGLIGSVDSFKKNIARLTSSLDDANAKLKLPTNKKSTASLKRRQARLEKEIKEQEALLEEASNRPVMPANETVYFPRYFDMTKIKANREGFTKAIIKHYLDNPIKIAGARDKMQLKLADDIESVTLRAEDTVKKILEEGEYDPLNPDSIFMGIGASKHQLGRKLDISNKEILQFIEADPIKVMDEYVKRLGPRIEWEKMYGGRSIDDLLDEIDEDGILNNMSTAKINKARKEFLVMYDRIVGRVVDDPARIDNKIAYVMKSAAGLNFLGSAGLATITEPAVMFMNHEVGTVFKNLFALLKRAPEIQQALRETKEQYAEALEMEIGGAQIRLSDEMRGQSKTAKVWEKGTDAFYKLNGLAPLTAFLKHWESLNRQHSIIDYSIKWTKGEANTFEQQWLLRNGIDFKTAEKIVKSPWQKGASGLYLANISNWKANIDMPITKADIVVGPIKGKGKNKSAFFRQSEGPNGTIYIDEEYVAAQFDSKPWTNPKVKGVKPLPADAFKTPQEWVEFVKIHEIMHSNNSAQSLGLEGTKKVFRRGIPKGFSRKDLVEYLNKGIFEIEPTKLPSGKKFSGINMDLGYHLTGSPSEILEEGFSGGGVMLGMPHHDSGYGNYIAIFDMRAIKKKFNVDQLSEDDLSVRFRGRSQEPVFKSNFASKLYGEANFALKGEKPIAIIHVNEIPEFKKAQAFGARSEEMDVEIAEATFFNDLEYAYLKGKRGKELEDIDGFWVFYNSVSEAVKDLKQLKKVKLYKYKSPVKPEKATEPTIVTDVDYENIINDMALTEIRNQQEGLVEKSTTEKFRAAMTDGILNTILMGTPADKPILADGVMFLPMHIASTMGLKEHPRYRGYARVESGLLNMPLQFYSYLMAAANKVQGSMVQGQNKNKAITIAAFMGLGYLQYELRVPDFVKEKDSWDTKMLRAFDYGGLGGIYSDLLYTGLHTGIEMTGKNFTNGMVSAKYGAEQNLADGVAGLLGAGPDISLSYGRASADIFQGKFGEGTQEFLQILPFLKLWFIKKEMRELGRTFGRMD